MEVRSHRPEECARAARRGFEFMLRFAREPEHFKEWGSDLLGYFYGVADTAADADLRRRARAEGLKLARRWRRLNPSVAGEAEAETFYDLIYGSLNADLLGARDPKLKAQLRTAARRFSAVDFIWFDPSSEPPPDNVPDDCPCGFLNERGRKTCARCRRRLSMSGRYLIWYVALIRTYMAARYGVSLGATYADVLRWLPTFRPYPASRSDADFWDAAYAVTHVVFTLNDYDKYRLRPAWLPQEFAFLKKYFMGLIEGRDAETTGEFIDCLKCFGLSGRSPLIRAGTDFLLESQNADGSWGKTDGEDTYRNYHVTLAATAGLMEVRWRAPRLAFPELMPLLKGRMNKKD